MDLLYIGSNSGQKNKIGVAGSRFLRGVAGKVSCDEEYKEWSWCACLDDATINNITVLSYILPQFNCFIGRKIRRLPSYFHALQTGSLRYPEPFIAALPFQEFFYDFVFLRFFPTASLKLLVNLWFINLFILPSSSNIFKGGALILQPLPNLAEVFHLFLCSLETGISSLRLSQGERCSSLSQVWLPQFDFPTMYRRSEVMQYSSAGSFKAAILPIVGVWRLWRTHDLAEGTAFAIFCSAPSPWIRITLSNVSRTCTGISCIWPGWWILFGYVRQCWPGCCRSGEYTSQIHGLFFVYCIVIEVGASTSRLYPR